MPEYNIDVLFDSILAAVAAQGSIAQRMHMVIDECERQLPHADWERMRCIDFHADEPALEDWLIEAFSEGAVRAGDRGLWFGLFNPLSLDGRATSELYVASGPIYEDESPEWPCKVQPNKGASFLDSEVLDAIYRLAYDPEDGLQNNAEYPLALAYATMAACSALGQRKLAPELAALRGAAAGFDSGDGLYIGVFDNLRFRQLLRPY